MAKMDKKFFFVSEVGRHCPSSFVAFGGEMVRRRRTNVTESRVESHPAREHIPN